MNRLICLATLGLTAILASGCHFHPRVTVNPTGHSWRFTVEPRATDPHLVVSTIVVRADDMSILWQVQADPAQQVERLAFTYGEVPSGFEQQVPAQGPPARLESVSRFGLLIYGEEWPDALGFQFDVASGEIAGSPPSTENPAFSDPTRDPTWRPKR